MRERFIIATLAVISIIVYYYKIIPHDIFGEVLFCAWGVVLLIKAVFFFDGTSINIDKVGKHYFYKGLSRDEIVTRQRKLMIGLSIGAICLSLLKYYNFL